MPEHVRPIHAVTLVHLESKSMHVRPLHDRLIIQRLEEGEQKVGGISLPPPPRQPLRDADGRTAWCTSRKAPTDWWQPIRLLARS
jgi:hypothetical protein